MIKEVLLSQTEFHRQSGLTAATFSYLLRQCAFPPPVFRFKDRGVWPAYAATVAQTAAADPYPVTQSNAPLLRLADVRRVAELLEVPIITVRRCLTQGCVPPAPYLVDETPAWVEAQIAAAASAIRKAILNRSECPDLLQLPPYYAMIAAASNALNLEPAQFALRVYSAGISHFEVQVDTAFDCVYTIRVERQVITCRETSLRVAFEQLFDMKMSNHATV